MHFVVLIKYVADVEKIPEDAWDTEKGTLIRSRLKMVANPLDDRALQLALELRGRFGGKVTVVSMGPPSAEEICRRAVMHGADEAALICDNMFAGSDTLATSKTLAKAIRMIVPEGADGGTMILAGMQSPDGDTAQVPFQVAGLLDYPVLPYISGWRTDAGRPVFETLKPVGRGEAALERLPLLATVTGYCSPLPFHVSFDRMAVASEVKIRSIGNKELSLSENETGLSGSWTRVIRIFTSRRKGRAAVKIDLGCKNPAVLESLSSALAGLEDFLRTGGTPPADTEGRKASAVSSGAAPYYTGDVWVLCEREDDGAITRGSIELLGEAKRLSAALGCRAVAALACGELPASAAETLASFGADRTVHVCTAAGAGAGCVAESFAQAISEHRPQAVLAPATMNGRVLAPLIAVRLEAGLTADCTGLDIDDFRMTKAGKLSAFPKVLFQTRPALGGNIMATIVSLRGRENASPQMATVRPGIFAPAKVRAAACEVIRFVPSLRQRPPHFTEVQSAADVQAGQEVELAECDVIVSAGFGIGSRDNIARLAAPLVDAIRERWNVKVGLACSRAAVEAGFLEYPHQVGQTGKVVRPKIYVALGVSGAVQHLVGMEGAAKILSVNKDPDAPMNNASDVAVIGDVADAVPAIMEIISHSRNG